jgi:outer membrane lipoprotein SlyB
VGGAVLGGLAGSLIGGGTGQVLATTVGAGAGAFAGERLTCG